MASMTKLEAWKAFLRGRIAQERGDNRSALAAFDEALAADPGNRNFERAKAALFTLTATQDEALADIEREYFSLAKRHVGENDKPDAWIAGLERLLQRAEQAPTATLDAPGATALPVVW